MNNEIKEILEFIKEQIEKETLSYEPDIELSKEEAKRLLDYITNLQTIEQQYCAILSENADLQQENKKLKELCDKYEKEHKTTYEIWKKDIYLYNSVVDRNERLNNIINELERYTLSNYKYYTGVNDVSLARKQVYKDMLGILKELKENK